MITTLIYGLIDPRTRLIRYVGKSVSGLYRPRAHACPSNLARHTHTAAWCRQLAREELRPDIAVLEYAPRETLAERERWWIAYGRALGWDLTNHTDGGEGVSGLKFSDETRAKISAANRGRVPSAETRARMSEAQLHRAPITDETRAKLRLIHLGKKRSDEFRRQQSERLRGKPGRKGGRRPDLAARNRENPPNRGRRMSDEQRAKIGAAQAARHARNALSRPPAIRINLLPGASAL